MSAYLVPVASQGIACSTRTYTKVPGCCSPDHGRIIIAKGAKHLPQVLLCLLSHLAIHGGKEGCCTRPRCEPVAAGEPLEEGNVVLLDLGL